MSTIVVEENLSFTKEMNYQQWLELAEKRLFENVARSFLRC